MTLFMFCRLIKMLLNDKIKNGHKNYITGFRITQHHVQNKQ